MQSFKWIYQTTLPEPVRAKLHNLRNGLTSASLSHPLQKPLDLYKSKGCMFIHIPKAAGVSVFQALYGEDSWGHAPLSAFVDAFGREEVYGIPRACMVRDPYLRLHSGYAYLRKGGRGKGFDTKRQELLRPYDTFEKFVKDYLSTRNALEIIHFKPQTYWVTDESGALGVDYVGRFETINESFDEMVKQFAIDATPLETLNKTASSESIQSATIRNIFDDEMISIVNSVYADDFRLFNYPRM